MTICGYLATDLKRVVICTRVQKPCFRHKMRQFLPTGLHSVLALLAFPVVEANTERRPERTRGPRISDSGRTGLLAPGSFIAVPFRL